jgi:hypothetical protein
MPGTLPNTNIKNAIDQVIAAINGLELTVTQGEIVINPGDVIVNPGEVIVNLATVDIVAKLEEIRTLYETESLASTVAQNTNFSDLIDAIMAQTAAIGALVLSCETVVNSTTLHQTINAGGGCGGGTEMPPVVSTDPAAEPPPGWGPADPAIPDRRCKACNRLVGNFKYVANELYKVNLNEVATLGVGAVAAILTAIFVAAAAGPLGVLAGIVTGIGAVVLAFLAVGVRFDFLNGIFQNADNRKLLVCALYDAGSAQAGQDAFLQVLDDLGANTPEHYAIQLILELTGATNSIDYSRGGSEVDLSGYVSEVDCSDCGPDTGPYTVLMGTETSEHPSNPILITTVYNPARSGCGTNVREINMNFHAAVTITSITVVGNGPGACGGTSIYNYYAEEDFVTNISSGNGRPQDTAPPSGVRSLILVYHDDGNSPSVTITYTVD